jgi:hypothetical protein
MKKSIRKHLDKMDIIKVLKESNMPKEQKNVLMKVSSNIKKAKFSMKNIRKHRDISKLRPIFPRILCDDFEIEIKKSGRWYQIVFEGCDDAKDIKCNIESAVLDGKRWYPDNKYYKWNLSQVKFILTYVYKIPYDIVKTFKHNSWYPNSCG